MGKYGKAKRQLEHALQMINSESIDIKKDKIANICMKLELAFLLMNKQTESKKHYRNALQHKKELKQKESCPKKCTDYLLDMSNCAWYSNKKRKAIKYLDKALKTKKDISSNPEVDIEYANILGNKGLFLMETDPQEARKVFEHSLKIFQETSLDGDADRNMAVEFLLAGKTCAILKKYELSKYYSEQAFSISKRTCDNEKEDMLFLSCVHGIAESQLGIDKSEEAIDCFKKVLQVQESLLEESDSKSGIIHNLKNIGYCFSLSNYPERSLDYFQRVLLMQKEISFNPETDKELVETLLGISSGFSEMKNYQDALIHAEKALQIAEDNSLDVETDITLTTCLEKVGWCYNNLEMFEKALEYFCKSLLISTSKSVDIKSDSSLILVVNQIGFCYSDLGSISCALDYFNISLLIQKTVSLDVEKDAELSNFQLFIGSLYLLHVKDFEAAIGHFENSLFVKTVIISRYLQRLRLG